MPEYDDLQEMNTMDEDRIHNNSVRIISSISDDIRKNRKRLQEHIHADIFFTLMMAPQDQLQKLDRAETRRLLGDDLTNTLRQGLQ
ncbi:MAG: hypothetical protein WCJ81_02830 [bacterium]